MNNNGKPTRRGEVRIQAGATATSIATDEGLRWQVRRESDGLIRITGCLAQTRCWVKP